MLNFRQLSNFLFFGPCFAEKYLVKKLELIISCIGFFYFFSLILGGFLKIRFLKSLNLYKILIVVYLRLYFNVLNF